MEKKTLLKCWKEIKCRLMRGRHGTGVFAIVPIAKGEEPLPGDRSGPRWVKLLPSDYDAKSGIDAAVVQMMKDYHVEDEDGLWVLTPERGMVDPAWFVNGGRRDESNVEWIRHKGGSLMIALRDIQAGEELLLNYAELGKPL
jgi:hypothetical protein